MSVVIRSSDRVGILWGGGLGDALVIRPLLQRLSTRLSRPPVILCASAAWAGIYDEMDLRVETVSIPRRPHEAIRFLRGLGRFDLVYLGPHPTLPTRLLARAMDAGTIWVSPGDAPDTFIADTVCLDVRRLGLADTGGAVRPYGDRPLFRSAAPAPAPVPMADPYVVVHMTARPHWEAKQWPVELWQAWIERFLAEGRAAIVFVGSAEENRTLRAVTAALPAALRPRAVVETGLALSQLEHRIRGSVGVVCHNSGVMHVAVASEKPTVVLTGSPARFWRPAYPWVLNLGSGACGLACNQHRCPVPFFRAKCIRSLDSESVRQAVQSQFFDSAAASRARSAGP